MAETREIRKVEILADFCGHLSPSWLRFACHVALVQIDDQPGLYCDGDLVIGDEEYLRTTAHHYITAVLGTRQP